MVTVSSKWLALYGNIAYKLGLIFISLWKNHIWLKNVKSAVTVQELFKEILDQELDTTA